MPGYGAVGRFAVAGYRRDLELVSYAVAALDLTAVVYAPLAGLTVEYAVASLDLTAVEYGPSAGAREDIVPASLLLTALEYEGLPGSAVYYELPADVLALVTLATDPRAGASVHYHLPRAVDIVLSTVGGFTVGGGPAGHFEQPLRATPLAYAPRAGATANFVPAELDLIAVAYELGARRKPVRGQFMFYN